MEPFSQKFKKNCIQAFQHSPVFDRIIDNLEKNEFDHLRNNIDYSIDDLQDQINQPIGEGESSIHNARIHQLTLMYNCWYKLLEEPEIEDESTDTERRRELLSNKQS